MIFLASPIFQYPLIQVIQVMQLIQVMQVGKEKNILEKITCMETTTLVKNKNNKNKITTIEFYTW